MHKKLKNKQKNKNFGLLCSFFVLLFCLIDVSMMHVTFFIYFLASFSLAAFSLAAFFCWRTMRSPMKRTAERFFLRNL